MQTEERGPHGYAVPFNGGRSSTVASHHPARRQQLNMAPYNAVLEYRGAPHGSSPAQGRAPTPHGSSRPPKAGGGGDSSLPILAQNPRLKSPGPYEQSGGAHHTCQLPTQLLSPAPMAADTWLAPCAGSAGRLHPSGLLEQWSDGIGRSQPQSTDLACTARLEDVRPWTLRQWSQKSLWPQPPSAGELRATSPLRGVTPPPGANEFIRAEQLLPDAHELTDEARRRPPLCPLLPCPCSHVAAVPSQQPLAAVPRSRPTHQHAALTTRWKTRTLTLTLTLTLTRTLALTRWTTLVCGTLTRACGPCLATMLLQRWMSVARLGRLHGGGAASSSPPPRRASS
jgi:hypothetical protein